MRLANKFLVSSFLVLVSVGFISAQSRHSVRTTDEGSQILNVVATRKDGESKR